MNDDPIAKFNGWLTAAVQRGIQLHNAAALATCGNDRQPSVRMVLLKDVNERGFVFYTNLESRKARQLGDNSRASLCFWWPALKRQVRIEGEVELVDKLEADQYFASRPRGSQLGAWASPQSSAIGSREELLTAFAELTLKYTDQAVPRPPFWSGYRLVPERIEFWTEQPDRLHEREVYTHRDGGWQTALLAP